MKFATMLCLLGYASAYIKEVGLWDEEGKNGEFSPDPTTKIGV